MRTALLSPMIVAAACLMAACGDHSVTAGMSKGQGALAVRMVDAPTPLDSIKSVNIFVVRVDARVAHADSAAADSDADKAGDEGDRDHVNEHPTAWVTIASPNKLFDLLTLQGADTALLGTAVVDTAKFRALRLVIDPAKSNVVLKNGTVLTATTTPSIEFFSRGHHGILIDLDDDADVRPGATTTITIDFRIGESILLRGPSIEHDGLMLQAKVRGHVHKDS